MMLRMISGIVRTVGLVGKKVGPTSSVLNVAPLQLKTTPQFQSLRQYVINYNFTSPLLRSPLLFDNIKDPKLSYGLLQPQVRTVTKYSLKKGKRKSVKAVVRRFFRLAWGGWIRTRAGRFKHLWRKREDLRYRYRQHVFCNATQSTMLDKMVSKYWKRRRYYVDDIYEPYHTREEFHATRRKPQPAPPR